MAYCIVFILIIKDLLDELTVKKPKNCTFQHKVQWKGIANSTSRILGRFTKLCQSQMQGSVLRRSGWTCQICRLLWYISDPLDAISLLIQMSHWTRLDGRCNVCRLNTNETSSFGMIKENHLKRLVPLTYNLAIYIKLSRNMQFHVSGTILMRCEKLNDEYWIFHE